MGLFSNLFGKKSNIERQLEEMYVSMYVVGKGMTQIEAQTTVRDLIKQVKEEAEKEGSGDIPENFGNILLSSEKNDVRINNMLIAKRKEGVRNEDIKWWWNMHDLERRLLIKEDELSRMAFFIHHLKEGKTSEESASLVMKYFPLFGNHEDTSKHSGDDRPLPYELKDRINIYIQKRASEDADNYKKDIESYSSFNALIRTDLKRKNL